MADISTTKQTTASNATVKMLNPTETASAVNAAALQSLEKENEIRQNITHLSKDSQKTQTDTPIPNIQRIIAQNLLQQQLNNNTTRTDDQQSNGIKKHTTRNYTTDNINRDLKTKIDKSLLSASITKKQLFELANQLQKLQRKCNHLFDISNNTCTVCGKAKP